MTTPNDVQTQAADTPAPTKTVAAEQAVVATPEPVVTPVVVEQAAAPAAVVEAPVKETAAPVVSVTAPAPSLSDFQIHVNHMKTTGSATVRSLILSLESYMLAMAPGKPISGADGHLQQYTLWKVIYNLAHRCPQEEFKAAWSLLLAFFNEYKDGVFEERYIFRFSEEWNKTRPELVGFQRVINLLKVTANPSTRNQSLKQVDLNRNLADGFTEEGRQRIVAFYGR